MRAIPGLMLALAIAGCGSGATSEADQLACPGRMLTAEEREALVRHVRSQARPTERDLAPLQRVGTVCASKFDWSNHRAAMAAAYALADLGQTDIRQRLARRGFDVGQVEQAILAESAPGQPSDRADPGLTPGQLAMQSATEALRRRPGFAPEDESELDSFIVARAAMEVARREFAAPKP